MFLLASWGNEFLGYVAGIYPQDTLFYVNTCPTLPNLPSLQGSQAFQDMSMQPDKLEV